MALKKNSSKIKKSSENGADSILCPLIVYLKLDCNYWLLALKT